MPTRKKVTPAKANNFDLFSNLEQLDDDKLREVEAKVQEIKVARRRGSHSFSVGRYQYVYEPALQQLFSLKNDGHLYPSSYQFLVDIAIRGTGTGKTYLIRNILEHMIRILSNLLKVAV